MLVIVATAAAGKSQAVRQEIETFPTTRRLTVPIDLDGTITQADWWPLLEGLAISIEEPASEARIATRPSREVLDRIENCITFTRRNEKLRRATIATLVTLVLLVAGAILAAGIAASARDENTRLAEQNGTANRQLAETRDENTRLTEQNGTANRQLAETQHSLSSEQGKLSRQVQLTKTAIAQGEAAQRAMQASEAQYAKQKELTAKATEERVAAETQLAASKANLEQQTAIAESLELARVAPSAPTERQRMSSAVEAVQRFRTVAARLNLADILLKSLRTGGRTDVAVGPRGQQVAIASGAGDARYFDITKQAEFSICGYPEPVDTVKFSTEGKYLVTARPDGSKTRVVQIWDASRGIQTGVSEINRGPGIFKLWISPDSGRLLVYWGDPLYIVEMPTGRILTSVKLEGEDLTQVTFDPHHRTFLTEINRGGHKVTRIFDVDSGSNLWTHSGNLEFEWFDYVSASKLLAYLEGGPTTQDEKGFKIRPGRAFGAFPLDARGAPAPPHSFTVDEFDYSELTGASIKFLQAGKSFGQALKRQYPAARCDSYNQPVNATGELFLCFDSGKSDAPVLFELGSRRALGPLQDWHFGNPHFGFFSPDSSLLEIHSSVYANNSVTDVMTLWDRSTRRFLWKREGYDEPTEFSADGGRLFLSLSHRVFNARSGEALKSIRRGNVLWMNKDGNLVVVQDDNVVFLWDVDEGKELRSIDITTPDIQANRQALELLNSGAYSVDDLLAIARREQHGCSPKQ